MERKSRLNKIICALTAMVVAGICACTSTGSHKPIVSVSIAPQKYIVEQIAGDKVEVRTLMSQGADPESYEPSMSHLLNIEKSEAYLRMGYLGFEDAILSKVSDSRPDLPIYNMTDGVALISGTHCGHDHAAGEGHDHADAEEIDPHTWSSVANARTMAANVLRALNDIDPDNSKYYTERYNRFVTHLDSLDWALRAILAEGGKTRFIVWHPSLSYFARDYGLEQIALGSENKELSVPGLRKRIDEAGSEGDVALLLQRDFDTRQAQVVNKEIGGSIVYINPMNPEWEEELIHTAKAISLIPEQ